MRLRLVLLALAFAAISPALHPAPAPGPAPAAPAPYDADRFRAELGRLLAAHFNLDGDLQVDFLRPWSPPAQAAAIWQVVLTDFPSEASGLMVLRCRLVADGVPADDESVMVRASLWRDVWFARQPVPAGTVFDPALLEARRVDCFRVHDALPATAGDRSLIMARDVAADRMLTWHDLARRPLVRKGDLVEAEAREGELFVSMMAVALENGANGDTITLRNPESHNEISGRVIDDNRVEISF